MWFFKPVVKKKSLKLYKVLEFDFRNQNILTVFIPFCTSFSLLKWLHLKLGTHPEKCAWEHTVLHIISLLSYNQNYRCLKYF